MKKKATPIVMPLWEYGLVVFYLYYSPMLISCQSRKGGVCSL